MAVRTALGAELPRLARQFLVENLLLAVGAAALGVPLAYGLLRALMMVAPANIPRLTSVSLDGGVLLVALGVSLAIGLVFGVLPVAQARRLELQTALRAEDTRGATTGRDGRLLRSSLVVAEVALAVRAADRRRPADSQLLEPQPDRSGFRRHRGAEGGVPGLAGAVPGGARRGARTSWPTTASPTGCWSA